VIRAPFPRGTRQEKGRTGGWSREETGATENSGSRGDETGEGENGRLVEGRDRSNGELRLAGDETGEGENGRLVEGRDRSNGE
jgi:hypothetical protein